MNKSISLSSALNKKSASVAINITLFTFLILSAFLFWSTFKQKIEVVNEKVTIDRELLLKSLKIGDHFFITKYTSSFVESQTVAAAGIYDQFSKEWVVTAPEDNQTSKKFDQGIKLHLNSTTIPMSILLDDGNGRFWRFYYLIAVSHFFLVLPILLSVFLSVFIFLFLRRKITETSRYFTSPIEGLARDLTHQKKFATAHLQTKNYDNSPKFKETDTLVNELKSLLQLIGEQQEKLKETEVLEAISQLSKQVAHDIQSPIGALKTAVTSIENNPKASTDLISKATKRIQDIAEDLRVNNRIGLHSKNVFTEVSINEWLQEIIQEKKTEYKGKWPQEFELIFEPLKEKTLVKILVSDLSRSISNIINNSFEASPGRKAVISVELQKNKDHLTIHIKDEGKGIAPDSIRKVLDYGFTDGKATGSGLGLAFADQVVEKHRGHISIESQLNQGTTVSLHIPLSN